MATVEEIRSALESVKDPDFDLGILDMGLVYDISVGERGDEVKVVMTLTSPMCPLVAVHRKDVEESVLAIAGVKRATVEFTFSPPWDPATMATDDVKAILGIW
jgi:metal-sulfur cluster biosynthetic enzyme